MIVYRVALRSDADGSAGYGWFARRRDAQKFGKEYQEQDDGNGFEISRIAIKLTGSSVLAALNDYAGHPNNG